MEVALKERLVGAVVLVALGVWLIPVFLDGPQSDDDATGSQPLALPMPATETPDRTTKTIRLNKEPSAPSSPTMAAATPSTEAAEVVSVQPTPEPKRHAPKTDPKPAPAAKQSADTRSGWFVQLGSFGSEANAKRLAAQVAALGWDAQLSQLAAGQTTMHRVRVGPLPSRTKADALRRELLQRGFDGKVMNEPKRDARVVSLAAPKLLESAPKRPFPQDNGQD